MIDDNIDTGAKASEGDTSRCRKTGEEEEEEKEEEEEGKKRSTEAVGRGDGNYSS